MILCLKVKEHTDPTVEDRLKNLNQWNLKRKNLAKKNKASLKAELVGIKNLKIAGAWRIEFDVYEFETEAVKDLMDMLNKPVAMGLVQIDD